MLVNYISIKTTIGRFLKELGLEDTSYAQDIPQWVEDAVQIMGIPNYYVYKHRMIKIEDYRGTLPCDIESIHGFWVTNNYTKCTSINLMRRLFIRNSPLFGEGIQTVTGSTGYGSVNGGFIHTSFKKGIVYLVYQGIPLDCDGYPLVPKDAKVNEALQYYFIYRMSLSGYKHPVVSFDMAYQMWTRLYPAAANSVNWMDLQDLQEFTEMWTNVLLGDLHNNNYIH